MVLIATRMIAPEKWRDCFVLIDRGAIVNRPDPSGDMGKIITPIGIWHGNGDRFRCGDITPIVYDIT